MKKTLFSIIIPVYNTEKYIRACIESILAQTSDAYEMIIVDDGSTDQSVDIIRSMIKGHPNYKLIHNTHSGVCTARNTGLDAAEGDYICFIDSDDIVYSDYISSLEDAVQRYNAPDVIYYYTHYGVSDTDCTRITEYNIEQLCREDIEFLSAASLYHTPEVDLPSGKYHLITSFSAGGQVYKKSLFLASGVRYRPGIKRSEDGLLNLELLNYARNGVIIKKELYIYRTDNTSATRSYIPDLMQIFHLRDSCVKNVISRLYSGKYDLYMQKYYCSLIYQMRVLAENCFFHTQNHLSYTDKCKAFMTLLEQPDYAHAINICTSYYLTSEDKAFLRLAKKKKPELIVKMLHGQAVKNRIRRWLSKKYRRFVNVLSRRNCK